MNVDQKNDDYCFPVRRYLVMGIAGTVGAAPVQLADFVMQWEPTLIIRPHFCQWCGERLPPDAPVTAVGPPGEQS